MNITDKKSYVIQMIRGLAIIAVVFIHNTPSGMSQVLFRPFLNFAVGTFLFLSGMLSSSNNWKPWKRIVKVIIPYMIWSLVYVILNHFKEPTQIPLIYIKALFTASAAAIMYYVFVYCELTLLIPLIDKLARSKYKTLGYLISPIEIIIMRIIPLFLGIEFGENIKTIMKVSFLGWFIYFYLGYMLGNGIVHINVSNKKLILALLLSIPIQIAEGYFYFNIGNTDCGTQLKLSSLFTGCIFTLLAFKMIYSEKIRNIGFLHLIGEFSFGIFFSHIAIMKILGKVSFYSKYTFYPINAILIVIISTCFVFIGRKLLNEKGKYLAF